MSGQARDEFDYRISKYKARMESDADDERKISDLHRWTVILAMLSGAIMGSLVTFVAMRAIEAAK